LEINLDFLWIPATIDNPNVNAYVLSPEGDKLKASYISAFAMGYCSISLLDYQWQAPLGWLVYIPSGLKSKASYAEIN